MLQSQTVLHLLQQSMFAEQMVCSMSTQLFHIPQTRDLKGNREMHEHLVPASYHRVTAIGSAGRLANGQYHESIVMTLMACVENANKEDQQVMKWLFEMKNSAPTSFQPFIQEIIQWQEQTEYYLALVQQEINKVWEHVQ